MKKETYRPQKTRTYRESNHFIDSQDATIEEFQSLHLRLEEAIDDLSVYTRSLPDSKSVDRATVDRLNVLKLYRSRTRLALDTLNILPDDQFRMRRKEYAGLFDKAQEALVTGLDLNIEK